MNSGNVPPGGLKPTAQTPDIVLYPSNYDGFHRTEYRPDGPEPTLELSQTEFERFRIFISEKIGLNYLEDQRRQLTRGLVWVMGRSGCKSTNELYALLAASATTNEVWDQMVSALTVGETYFFRNSFHFDALGKMILPDLLAQRGRSDRRIRIWSAGCATGEEPYSIAILLRELVPNIDSWNITVLATDINREALRKAQQGVYAAWSFRGVEKRVQETYFKPIENKLYALVDDIKKMVIFDYLNLAQDAYPSLTNNTNAIDIIFCRNVTIYFNAAVTQNVINNFHHCLTDGGWLIPGPSEPNMVSYNQLEQRNFPGAVVYQRVATRHQFMLPLASPSVVIQSPKLVPITPAATKSPVAALRPNPVALVPDPYPQALTLIQQGRAAEAQKKLYEKIDRDANFVPAYYALGKIYANQGELSQAQHWCEQAIAKDRLHPEPYYTLSMICQENGLIDNAIEALKKAIFLDRGFLLAHYNLAQIYRRKGDADMAIKSLQNIHKLLESRSRDDIVPEGDGMRVGRLLEMVECQLKESMESP